MQGIMFAPKEGGSFVIANATTSAAGVALPTDCDKVALYNSSEAANAFYRITTDSSAAELASGLAPTTTTCMIIPPKMYVQVYTGPGPKIIRAIADIADGNLHVTPGRCV